eukprot:CAMPEP_0173266952 /NCGR_PEP_ID=MMETSP1142-20121109/29490_1 /TAXON_ID=483371 /ORGANISM="non described non described, Strain CCMP2298" /LENGTH=61 /DNA_ID=CAMNT_0014203007 /DNA_START=153 /DNA_END=334 /DNA_ORIENTATION=-
MSKVTFSIGVTTSLSFFCTTLPSVSTYSSMPQVRLAPLTSLAWMTIVMGCLATHLFITAGP